MSGIEVRAHNRFFVGMRFSAYYGRVLDLTISTACQVELSGTGTQSQQAAARNDLNARDSKKERRVSASTTRRQRTIARLGTNNACSRGADELWVIVMG